MSEQKILNKLRDHLVDFDIEGIKQTCKDAIAAGIPAYKVAVQGMGEGIKIVGQKYKMGEYFLAELMMAGETMKEGMKILEPHLQVSGTKIFGKVVVGVVKGDIHDIGKNIFVALLKASGFSVIDLGVDVSTEKFVEAVNESKADILAMSAYLTTTMPEIGKVMKALKEKSIRDKIKVIIGGLAVTDEYAKKIGTDASASSAIDGVDICKKWRRLQALQEKKV